MGLFVGRAEELRALARVARTEDSTAAALVTGEPGSGKTRLLTEARSLGPDAMHRTADGLGEFRNPRPSDRFADLKLALLLLALGVATGACGSTGMPSVPAIASVTADSTVAADPQVLELSISDFTFSTDLLRADAGRPIIISLSNEDGVVHNFQLWRDDTRTEKLFFGELFDGPGMVEYEIGVLEPGTYRFECHPHAGSMVGHLIVVEPAP